MAASMTSSQACKSCRFIRTLRRFSITNLSYSQTSSRLLSSTPSSLAANTTTQDNTIVIPKRKQKDDFAVLRALGNTVAKDPTGQTYMYHDDPYLAPRNVREKQLFKKTFNSGKKAAQYVLQKYPNLFNTGYTHDEPKIEAFYPPVTEYVFTEPCEKAILERVDQNDINGAWDMYKTAVEQGIDVSLETCNALLDQLCFYSDIQQPSLVEQIDKSIESAQQLQQAMKEVQEQQDLDEEEDPSTEEIAETPKDETNKRASSNDEEKSNRKLPKWLMYEVTWNDGNRAEQLFEVMKDKNSHSYNTMIQGMVKHHAHGKAFTMYNEMQQRGLQADEKTYNALIKSIVFIREETYERWTVLLKLLQQMEQEGVRPTLYTFNEIMTTLSRSRDVGRRYVTQVINEMKALGIEPSLGIYNHLLRIHRDDKNPVVEANILYDIMDSIEGKELTLRHSQDVLFFVNAMHSCLKCKDVELAYRLDTVVNTGNNVLLLGNENYQNHYYSRLFSLICQMESADAMLEYYENLVPSAIIPTPEGYCNILQALESAGAYDKMSVIWNDASSYGYKYDDRLVECLLTIMAMSTDVDSKLQEDMCRVAEEITGNINFARNKRAKRRVQKGSLNWTSTKLNNMVVLYLKCHRPVHAWKTLELCKATNMTPSTMVIEDLLSVSIDTGNKQIAVGCVQVAAHFLMSGASIMAERIKEEMLLDPSERKRLDFILQERRSTGEGFENFI